MEDDLILQIRQIEKVYDENGDSQGILCKILCSIHIFYLFDI